MSPKSLQEEDSNSGRFNDRDAQLSNLYQGFSPQKADSYHS